MTLRPATGVSKEPSRARLDLQALEARRKTWVDRSTMRSLNPGTHFLRTQSDMALLEQLQGAHRHQGQSTLTWLLRPDQFERVHALWSLAEGCGIHQVPEQVAFCQFGLELGPDFHL